MFCSQCGKQQSPGARFCSDCGNPVGQVPGAGPPQQQHAPPPPPPPAQYVPPVASSPVATGHQGLTPPGGEMIVVSWKAAAGRHPVLGRYAFDVLVTDKRIAVSKSGLKSRLGKSISAGALATANLGSVLEAATSMAFESLGSALANASYPEISQSRVTSSAEVDQLVAQTDGMMQVPNSAISQVRMKKGFLVSKATFVLPQGELTVEIDFFKDTAAALAQVFPGRLIQQ